MRWLMLLSLLALAPPLRALAADDAKPEGKEAPAEDPKIVQAKKLLTQYLELVKKKKWPEAKKLVHPKTLDLIGEMKKRNKETRHHLSPQDSEKCCFYLKDYTIDTAELAVNDTVVINVKENNWQVEERGITENEPASYLLGVHKGKWYLADKLQNGTFNEDGIRIGHKGYFDNETKKPAPAPKEED